ncbi:DUF3311 domain-containing protein [Acinetobacter rudis]|uniref:DUF3311 domain-containing protein n=1 Tax=Acinetobacter rudis TaxID=632955 RepID=A0AAW8J7W3_9GAMM|nr:DUF3311 domain-containing protein [Acinetobacter rudis]MDQ8935839.1 DUF3311 domain-containing protein [Acinetobacter rudis]MDQ8954328.1 DUF3311 domain-containing protein [Acinetobacter rudis]MDQ9018123.1 DUF3311 domain-containing protein [Acinetobacter rudis]
MTQKNKQWLKVIFVIGIPLFGVVGALPIINKLKIHILGIPIIYAWMFLWFILTTICLWICWYVFDRHDDA